MKIIFSDHAKLKIKQRKLSQKRIVETIEKPDSVTFSRGGREIALKKFRTNHMQVIIKREQNVVVVITAHWVARPRKAA